MKLSLPALMKRRQCAMFILLGGGTDFMRIRVRRALTKWGNGWILRLTKDEVAALGNKPGQAIEAKLRPANVGSIDD